MYILWLNKKCTFSVEIKQNQSPNTLAVDDDVQRHLKRPSLSKTRRFHLGLFIASTEGRG